MRSTVSFYILAIVLFSVPAIAEDTLTLLNRFLDKAAKRPAADVAPATQAPAPVVARVQQPDYDPQPVRVAQKRRSVLNLGDEKVSSSTPTLATKQTVDPKVELETKRAEAAIERRMQNLEASLRREEQRLEARLGDLNKKRTAALEKNDEKQLKLIENTEKQAIAAYERKVQRMLDSAVASTKAAPVRQPVASQSSANWNKPTKPTAPTSARKPINKPKPEPEQKQRRRFRLWPFK